jgi:hypothetical protein
MTALHRSDSVAHDLAGRGSGVRSRAERWPRRGGAALRRIRGAFDCVMRQLEQFVFAEYPQPAAQVWVDDAQGRRLATVRLAGETARGRQAGPPVARR